MEAGQVCGTEVLTYTNHGTLKKAYICNFIYDFLNIYYSEYFADLFSQISLNILPKAKISRQIV